MKKRNGCSWFAFLLLGIALVMLMVAFLNGSFPQLQLGVIFPWPTQEITTTQAPPTQPPVTQPAELARAGSFRYHYSQLDEAQQENYRNILELMPYFPESVDVSGIDEEGLRAVFNALLLDQPMLFQISATHYTIRSDSATGIPLAFVPLYRLDRDEYRSRSEELAELVQSIPLPQGGSEFDIQLALHDFLVRNCTYSDDIEDPEKSTAYGALVEGSAACMGYSLAMLLMLELNGIDAYVVTGQASNSAGFSGGHAWNKARIEGNWYYMDATWNDPVVEEGGREIVSRAYFNLSEQELGQTHEITDQNNRAMSTAQNYFRQTGLFFDRIDRTAEDRIAQELRRTLDAGDIMLEIRMSSSQALAQAVDYLFGRQQQRIYAILSAVDYGGTRIKTDSVHYSELEHLHIIRIYPVMR